MKAWRLLSVVALLVLAATVSAQDRTEYKVNDQTRCWDCHAPGKWNPAMTPAYDVLPLLANPVVGEEFDYRAELVNTWRAQTLDQFVTLDISKAPSLRFVGTQDPAQQIEEGKIVVEAKAPTAQTLTQPFLTQPQRGSVLIEVPTGATAVRIVMVPDNNDANRGPDLTMRIFDARTDPAGDPSLVINQAGKGGTEILHLDGASAVANRGFGNWTVQAQVIPIELTPGNPGGSQTDPQYGDVPFTVTMDAWFNATQEVQQVKTAAGPTLKGTKAVFTWRLVALEAPTVEERINVIANATLYYDHVPPTPDEEDWDNMTINRTAPFLTQPNGTLKMGLEPTDIVINAVGPIGVSMAAISEAVGYAAAFLLVASVWTGGIFGKASRRQMNVIFGSARRRVAFHNFLSYGIIAAAIAHMVIFVWDTIEPNYPWQLGLIWGGLGILAMFALGVTGAVQVPMIRKWNYATWRWTHFALSIAAIVFTLVHMMLDGQNFGFIQEALNYSDPLTPASQGR